MSVREFVILPYPSMTYWPSSVVNKSVTLGWQHLRWDELLHAWHDGNYMLGNLFFFRWFPSRQMFLASYRTKFGLEYLESLGNRVMKTAWSYEH